jgi:hypothetical protein
VHAGDEGVLNMKTFQMLSAVLSAELKVDVMGDIECVSQICLKVFMGKYAGGVFGWKCCWQWPWLGPAFCFV